MTLINFTKSIFLLSILITGTHSHVNPHDLKNTTEHSNKNTENPKPYNTTSYGNDSSHGHRNPNDVHHTKQFKNKTVPEQPLTYNTTSYGNDSSQVADFYYPTTIPVSNISRVIVIIHGGAWAYGQRSDMAFAVPFLRQAFPSHLIINMDYRLATWSSPGYPKQILDVHRLILFTRRILRTKGDMRTDIKFALFGGSAGAHLAMLYAYKYNPRGLVTAVVDVVGPVDLTDPAYVLNLVYNYMAFSLVGLRLYLLDPKIYYNVSPVYYITSKAPPTIGFYGSADPLVPHSQPKKLKRKLTQEKVPHRVVMFEGGHYFDWSEKDKATLERATVLFLMKYFN